MRAALLGAHLGEQCLHAVLRPHRLAWHHLVTRHEAFGITAEIDIDTIAINALDQAGQQFTFAVLVFLDDLLALGLAHLLHDDLFRRLRGNAPELDRFHRHLDVAARLSILVDFHRVDHA